MPRPVIALLTDFGLRDHYVAALKGVILGISPDATLVDVTHDIGPQDVLSASLELSACYAYFPAGTVFLVVVDPGVGTSRRAIAARAGEWFFVAPDNGVIAPVLDRLRNRSPVVVELAEGRYARSEISRTFEGRDRFAPAAAWLARGIDIGALGPRVEAVVRLDVPAPQRHGRALVGEILKVDRFGNLISNLDEAALALVGQRATCVRIGGRDVAIVGTYGDVAPGSLCALVGSSGYLEMAVRGGSAAAVLALGRGARVVAAVDPSALDLMEAPPA